MSIRSTAPLVFVDTETTGLDPHTRVAWEIGMIRVEPDGHTRSIDFFMDLTNRELQLADQEAMEIGGYDERYNVLSAYSRRSAAAHIAEFTDGAVFFANQAEFDAKNLADILESVGLKPQWHRKIQDIGTFAYGAWLMHTHSPGEDIVWPPSTHEIATALGVVIEPSLKHTALGDAQYVKDIYDATVELIESQSY